MMEQATFTMRIELCAHVLLHLRSSERQGKLIVMKGYILLQRFPDVSASIVRT